VTAGLAFTATCVHCAGRLVPVNTSGGCATERVAITKCLLCGREWLVCVQLRPLVSPESQRRARYRERVGV